ncbi:MAG: glycosyltransferase family 2 protein [Oscillospiraceae bacterium]|nr:glycosyltransferase family 2 protein [Oscillospiraceae bacterium]
MIVRNEEAVLERCLSSVKELVNEIIIADTGSEDSTKKIARSMGAKVYDYTWNDNFSDARNFSFSKAGCEYQFWLDADDVIEGVNRERFQQIKENLTADVVMLPYHTAFDENGSPVFTFRRERLLKSDMGFKWEGAVHECITPRGNIVNGDAAISHKKEKHGRSLRNLRIYQKLKVEGHEFSGRELYYYGRELADHNAYKAAISVFDEYLRRSDLWHPDCREACLCMAECYKAIGKISQAKAAAVRGLEYGQPIPELCCCIGGIYVEEKQYNEAVFWYRAAVAAGERKDESGFTRPEFSLLIPALQLCLCYDRTGKEDMSYYWHTVAMSERPDHPSCKYNEEYFKNKRYR